MTKGGKRRRGPARSESQDSLERYIPQFNKKRKPNNASEENLDVTKPVEEENTKASCVLSHTETCNSSYKQITSSDEDGIKNEVSKVTLNISEGENSNETVLSDTKLVDTGCGNNDTAKQPPGTVDFNGQQEECGSEDEKLPDAISPATAVENASPEDTVTEVNQSTVSDQAVMVIDIPEQSDIVPDMANTDEKPCFTDAATQVDDSTIHSNHTTAANKITSDPLIPALLDELSALK